MADKFQNKYRIPSARASWWDYSNEGNYFITICTANKEHWFGEIVDGEMRLSEIGRIAERCWNEIPQHFPFVELDSYVVMPNHVHGILRINKSSDSKFNMDTAETFKLSETSKLAVSTVHTVCKNTNVRVKTVETTESGVSEANEFIRLLQTNAANEKWKPKTLGVIINQYKRICTIHARKIIPHFAWQPRFHDHIIRNTDEFIRISHYICTNVEHWEEDCFYQNGMRI